MLLNTLWKLRKLKYGFVKVLTLAVGVFCNVKTNASFSFPPFLPIHSWDSLNMATSIALDYDVRAPPMPDPKGEGPRDIEWCSTFPADEPAISCWESYPGFPADPES